MTRSRCLLLSLLLLPIQAGAPALASGGVDQESARRALEDGQIRPLGEVLAAVHAVAPGDVVALKLKHEDKRWRYELKVLTATGKRREITVDAKTLAILDDDD